MHIRERLPYSLTHTVGKIDYWLHRMSLDRRIFGFTDFRRYRAWYRDQLSSFVVETLLSEKTYSRPYWNKEYLDRVVSDHMKGRGTYLREIRKVLQIEMIHRVLLEGKY